MNRKEYEDFQARCKNFLQKEGINNLASIDEEGSFSNRSCECCQRPIAGQRFEATGFNPTEKTVQRYSVCSDCLYYHTYGTLDDETMLAIDNGN